MARPRGSSKAASTRKSRPENLASLSTEVLRLRLQALNLPITGSKAELLSRLKAAVQLPRPSTQPAPSRVTKAKRTARKSSKSDRDTTSRATKVPEDVSDDSSSVGSVDGLEEDDLDLSQFGVPAAQTTFPSQQPGLFSDAQMAAIQDTVRLSVEQALNSRSFSSAEPFAGTVTPTTTTPAPCRQGAATPLGLHRPLDRNLEDKILRGEYIDFTLLLPDSLSRPQVPEIQLRLDDSVPGSTSPLSMVRKRKPVIDTFHKWLDAYTAYMLVLVSSYPRRSLELLKYQQIISRAATKFKGLAFLSYDEQFRRRAA